MRFIAIFFILIAYVYAKADKISDLSIPQTTLLDLNIDECDEDCLLTTLEQNQIFTFLSKYQEGDSLFLNSEFNLYKNILNVNNIDISMIKVALLVPSRVVGKYSKSTTKSILSYMIHKNREFDFKVFNSITESKENLLNAVESIKKEDYRYIIALLTENGIKNIEHTLIEDLFVYIPSINKKVSQNSASNIVYGGIDYSKQLNKLKSLANNKVVNFYDDSSIGHKLSNITNEVFTSIHQEKLIEQNPKFKRLIRYNKKAINSSSLILNTPIVKSSLILSQLNYHHARVKNILSTQLNYNPLIMNLTQKLDRRKLFVANSILNIPKVLNENNLIIDNSMQYDWVNYSTSIGIDYIYSIITGEKREFLEEITNNQVEYDTKIYKIGDDKIYLVN